jgi:hypothetical protein
MKIYSVLQIGEYHINHCEDYLFAGEIGLDQMLCAVMDGCTMGTDSYFISTLVGKLLRKIALEKNYKLQYGIETFTSADSCLRAICVELFAALNKANSLLMLDRNELLTTLILLLVNKHTGNGAVLVVGDGLVMIDGQPTVFDQDNKPDYLGFHLYEDAEEWYDKQSQKLLFENARDISIATDGIFMFSPVAQMETARLADPLHFLLTDTSLAGQEDMLERQLKKLEHTHGLKPTDDLAMIRLVW